MHNLINSNLPHVYLKPGELFLSRDPAIVSTVLGSCLSITFFEKSAALGAMCHVQLPTGSISEGFKYVDTTLDYMVNEIHAMGIVASSCEVKLFGGADVLIKTGGNGNRLSVGRQNIQEARRRFDSYGIVPKVTEVGGSRGCKLFFNSLTGEVFLKKIRKCAY